MTVQPLIRRHSALSWALILVAGLAGAAENRIELRDGGVVNGELVGIEGGVYRVRSRALGEVTIPAAEVLAIRAVTDATQAPAANTTSGPQGGDLAAIQQQLLANPDIMAAITRLQGDPAVQSALADPEFTRLILSGNLEALRTNPRFLGLMENPAIQAIIGQAAGR